MGGRDTQTRTVNLSFKVAKSELEQSRRALSDLVKEAKDLSLWGDKLSGTYRVVGDNLKSVTAKAIENRNNFLKGTQAFKEQITVLDRLKSARAAAESAGGGGATGSIAGGASRALRTTSSVLNLAGIDTNLGQLGAVAGQAAPLVAELGASTAQIAIAAPIAGVAIVALSIAAKKFAEDLASAKKRLDNAIDSQKTYYELLQTGTTESIKAGLEDLKVKLAVAEAVRRDIQAGQDQLKGFGIFQGLAEQFTGLKDKAEEADDEINNTRSQIDAYTKALDSSAVAANDAKEAEEKLAEERKAQQDESIAAVKSYNADVKRITDQERQAEIDAAKRFADNQIRIAQQAADAAEQALQHLIDARASLQLNAQRADEQAQIDAQRKRLDEQIAFQREETLAARKHANDLLEIQRKAREQEFDLALNRDFAGISQLRRNTVNQINEANRQYVDEAQLRIEAFQQKLKDDQEQFIRERTDRLMRYRQQLADLNAAYQKELQLIRQRKVDQLNQLNVAYRAELTQLRDKLTTELSLRRSAIVAELQLIQQGNAAKLALEAQYISQINNLLRTAITGSRGATTTTNNTQNNNVIFNTSGSPDERQERNVQRALDAAFGQLVGG